MDTIAGSGMDGPGMNLVQKRSWLHAAQFGAAGPDCNLVAARYAGYPMAGNWRDEKIHHLREALDKARAQRDQARVQIETMRRELEKREKRHRVLVADHRRLWLAESAARFNWALPPRELVEHIVYRRHEEVGEPTLDLLFEGYLTMLELRSLIESSGARPLAGILRVLDFGCGCGRVTRFLKEISSGHVEQVYGCDVDAEAIHWNCGHLADVGNFFVIPNEPPVTAALPAFDVILALSVFTHLPENMEQAWLRQLRVWLAPGGMLVATFHGESFHRLVPAADCEAFKQAGFVHVDLGRTPGLPDYYLTSFHTSDYVRRNWIAEFHSLIVPDTTLDGQEVALLIA